MAENYAFIGNYTNMPGYELSFKKRSVTSLGAMGYAMASNIRMKMPRTSTLFINDINASACTRFTSEYSSYGTIEIASSAKEAAENARYLISIVPDSKDVRSVYLDEQTGVIAARKDPERIMLECSTIDVQTTKAVGSALQEAGIGTYIDGPVSGGMPAAQAGTLALLIGYPSPSSPLANPNLSPRLTHLLSMLGPASKTIYLSHLGAGLTAKIANNYISGTVLLATAEALALGVSHGLDPEELYKVIKSSTGQSWMCDHVMPIPNVQKEYWVPSNSGYKPGFKTQMMIKDLSLGVESARQVGTKCSMAERAVEVWQEAAVDERCRGRDGSSIYLHVGGKLPEGYEDKAMKREDGTWEFAE
ncbi:3-hydroxyisobutyrate dehydrogenase [Curvularia clavata]|uniref:3-hydroxyisobutyrate dehydrogenase n=1 Tax=Curvularia clavata TaxID=95742 RepID=A0A9Q9DRQ0_CURCL|nr:3-hydroxyisobutyrate dehydrogenase [Curvularia clavata]